MQTISMLAYELSEMVAAELETAGYVGEVVTRKGLDYSGFKIMNVKGRSPQQVAPNVAMLIRKSGQTLECDLPSPVADVSTVKVVNLDRKFCLFMSKKEMFKNVISVDVFVKQGD